MPAKERTRDRVLKDTELALIWQCTAGDHDHDRIVRLLLLTGARREEVGSIHWSELEIIKDMASALWTLPKHRAKNHLAHEVPLGPLTIVQLPKRRGNNSMMFGATESGFSGWSRCKARLDLRILKKKREDFITAHGREPLDDEIHIPPWTLHDLRRTFSTWCNENDVEPHVVEALLNHASGSAKRGVAGIYNRATYRTQKTAALVRWEAHILQLAGQSTPSQDVASIRRLG
jgi:integrase